MVAQSSISSVSESDSEKVSDFPTRSASGKPAVLSLLDRLRAPQKLELTRPQDESVSYCRKRPFCSPDTKSVT